VLAATIVWVLLVPAPDWLAHHDVSSATGPLHETALDNARGRLLTLGAGLLAAGALLFTARTFTLSREGQVTDRYTKAIEQLGSEKLDVRIGGIYALERVARDSARDHPTVMEVLTAFIREHSQEQWPPPGRPASLEQERLTRPDVQAAVTVVGRRNAERDTQPIDLTGANLASANLRGANFPGANLHHANLSAANLTHGANLTRAILLEANLTGANLHHANLSAANLIEANLAGTFLTRADLRGADLSYATLTYADLRYADLSGADLDGADLDNAAWPADTPVPEGWERDADTGRLRAAGTSAETTQVSPET
jgi:uncharacterized protein YjbI with pentapeptide repeats